MLESISCRYCHKLTFTTIHSKLSYYALQCFKGGGGNIKCSRNRKHEYIEKGRRKNEEEEKEEEIKIEAEKETEKETDKETEKGKRHKK